MNKLVAQEEIGTKIPQGLHLFGNVRVNTEEEIVSIEVIIVNDL